MRIEPLTPDLAPAWDAFVDAHPDCWWWQRSGWRFYEQARIGGTMESWAHLDDSGAITAIEIREDRAWAGASNAALPPTAYTTQVIDLTRPLGELVKGRPSPPGTIVAGFRHSHRNEILRCDERYRLYDASDNVAVGQALHQEAAGRATRPQETWDLMDVWHREAWAESFVAGRQDTGELDGWIYVYGPYKGWCYLGHAAKVVPDVNTWLVWRALQWAKAQGATAFEMGWQGVATDDKGNSIEAWRRSFGGMAWPVRQTEGMYHAARGSA